MRVQNHGLAHYDSEPFSSIPLQTLHHYTAVRGLHISISGVCSTKNWSFGYESMLQSCNLPIQWQTLHETVPNLSYCQWTSKFPYCTHCTMKPVQNSQKHHYTGPWKVN